MSKLETLFLSSINGSLRLRLPMFNLTLIFECKTMLYLKFTLKYCWIEFNIKFMFEVEALFYVLVAVKDHFCFVVIMYIVS